RALGIDHADERPRLRHAGGGHPEALVGRDGLLLERRQLRVAEHAPPLAARLRLGGLRGLPPPALLGRKLLELRRRLDGRLLEPGCERAPAQNHERDQKRIFHGWNASLASRLLCSMT